MGKETHHLVNHVGTWDYHQLSMPVYFSMAHHPSKIPTPFLTMIPQQIHQPQALVITDHPPTSVCPKSHLLHCHNTPAEALSIRMHNRSHMIIQIIIHNQFNKHFQLLIHKNLVHQSHIKMRVLYP